MLPANEIASELLKEEQVNAYTFDGIRYDCGSKEGFLEANIEYGLQHPDIREHLIDYLRKLYERLEPEIKNNKSPIVKKTKDTQ